ncbi:Shedu anti-phage system protein SduA domain-containing protein [Ensifer aridi]|uniref:Shedu anti-phage system protein SduA domain-containing protein n=1 Tax=Ensifer aridi TaxID=1708715 RepID=UPI001FCD5B2C|nr:Shedu anti-phage system protein SduA domain-containing protein [Ensifer aridi]
MRPFDREMVVGAGGTDDHDRPKVDYLMNFTVYSVLVEIKRPNTPIFQQRRSGRAGTWRFSNEFIDAVSQVLEQKAEWLVHAEQDRTTTSPAAVVLAREPAIQKRSWS